jgi:WD40 repeat protein
MRRPRALALVALLATACVAPELAAPASAPVTPAPPAPAPATDTAPAPAPIAEAPIHPGDPALVVQRGLFSYAGVVRVVRGGKLVAVVDQGPDVRLFDAVTAEERMVLRGHRDRVNDVDLAPAGDRLVSAGGDRTARLWDLGTGRELATFFEGDLVYHARFSPDGRAIATVHRGAVRLWEADGTPRATLDAGGANVAWSPDGASLVTWDRGYDSTKDIAVWDARSGALRYRLPPGTSGLTQREVAWRPDGRLLAWSNGEDAVALSDAATGAVVRTIRTARKPGVVAFSPTGRHVAVVNEKLSVSLYETATGRLATSIRTKDHQSFAFSPDGARIAVTQGSGLEVYAVPGGGMLARLAGGDSWVTAFAFTDDGARVVGGAGIHAPELAVWDVGSGARVTARRRGRFERRVAWGAGGRVLASLGADGVAPAAGWEPVVRLWDTDSGALRLALRRPEGSPLHSDYHRVAVSSDGARVAASNMETGTLWDATTGRFLADLDQDDRFHTEHGLAFQPNGKLVATTGGKRAEVRLWDATTGKKVRALATGLPVAWSVAFRPDGAVLAVAGPRDVALFDVRSGGKLRTLAGPPGGVLELAWTPDGKALVAASSSGGVHVLDASSGALLGSFTAHEGQLRAIAVSADGELLATGGEDGTAKLWRLATRESVATIRARDGEGVHDLAFHPRAKALVTAEGALAIRCVPSGAPVYVEPVAAANGDLAGLAHDDLSHFGGDPAALVGVRFRSTPDARAPFVTTEGVATLARPRLVGDLVAGCAGR